MTDYKTIAESRKFIVLDRYTPDWKVAENFRNFFRLSYKVVTNNIYKTK